MSKYFFSNEEQKQCIIPFRHKTEEEAKVYRLEDNNIEFKKQILDNSKALYNLQAELFMMLLSCKNGKTITLDEEDCKLLYDMAYKEIEIDYSKLEK